MTWPWLTGLVAALTISPLLFFIGHPGLGWAAVAAAAICLWQAEVV